MRHSSEFAFPLSVMRERIATSDLLPPPYTRYQPLLADGLCFFLERIAKSRLRAIFAEQAAMPATAGTAERVVALLHHSPALHKLGQVVARDRRLQLGFRKRLQKLESLEPRTPIHEVRQIVHDEIKHWTDARITLEKVPLAEGSVAVVVPFIWKGPPNHEASNSAVRPPRGVFKLLKTGVHALLDQDLEVFASLGAFLDEDCERYHLPQLDYEDTFNTIRELLLHEVRLDQEQQHLAEAARAFAQVPTVIIPRLLPFCTPRLTAMERVDGVHVSEGRRASAWDGSRLARILTDALVVTPLFSRDSASIFHADPHAGNLLATDSGRLAILDWSLTGRLQQSVRAQLTQLLMGAMALDPDRVSQAVADLAQSAPQAERLAKVVAEALRQIRWGALPGASWLTDFLDSVVTKARVRLAPNLLLFRKALLTLEGVLADVLKSDVADGKQVLDQRVFRGFLQSWANDWPARLWKPVYDRSFATHLSLADVVSFAWSAPAIPLRWWTQATADLLSHDDRDAFWATT